MNFKQLKDHNQRLRNLFDYHMTKRDNEFYNFFYKSRNHYLINVLISSCDYMEKGFSFEVICKLLDSKFASRTTILTILEEGVSKKIFEKKTDSFDHRKQNYTLSDTSKTHVLNWLNDHPFIKE